MAAIVPYQPPGALMPAQAEKTADYSYDYPRQREPVYHGGATSGVAQHWVGVPGADPAMSWSDLPTAVELFMIAARGRVPDSTTRPTPGYLAPAEQWEAWLLEAGEDRFDQRKRFLALRTVIDKWPGTETTQIYTDAVNAYGPPKEPPAPPRRRRRRRSRW